MNCDDRGASIKNRRVKMCEVHEVQFGVVEFSQEANLLSERVVWRVDEDFGDARIRRCEGGEFGFIEKEHVFVVVIVPKKMLSEFVNITADAGEAGRVHSAVDADAHGSGGWVAGEYLWR